MVRGCRHFRKGTWHQQHQQVWDKNPDMKYFFSELQEEWKSQYWFVSDRMCFWFWFFLFFKQDCRKQKSCFCSGDLCRVWQGLENSFYLWWERPTTPSFQLAGITPQISSSWSSWHARVSLEMKRQLSPGFWCAGGFCLSVWPLSCSASMLSIHAGKKVCFCMPLPCIGHEVWPIL